VIRGFCGIRKGGESNLAAFCASTAGSELIASPDGISQLLTAVNN
jgi:hypothetical protein